MTDSVAVFPPGYRLTDTSTGAPINGAVLRFYDAGTTNPKTVYADADLTTALGTTVTTDSLGYPTSNGTTKTMVYVGSSPYKIRIETSAGVEIATHDSIKGAVEVSDATDIAVQFARPVTTKSLNYTVVAGDQSKVIAVNCSGGSVTLTLPSAVTVGSGWFVTVQHAGSANLATVETVSTQSISSGHISYGPSLPLTRSGEEVTLVSDGGNWRVISHTVPHVKSGQGLITVEDRLPSPPGSPVAGGWYIVTSSPSGDWSSFSDGDLVQRVGSTWVRTRPPSNSGWRAYVKDESIDYEYRGTAWYVTVATTAQPGTVLVADQAAMEAMTAGRAVTADMQIYNPLHPKVVALINCVGTASIVYGLRTSAVVDVSTGVVRLEWPVPLANFTWCGSTNIPVTGSDGRILLVETTRTSTSLTVEMRSAGALYDPSILCLHIWGDA